jgi:fatty-acyl-CoA synthase
MSRSNGNQPSVTLGEILQRRLEEEPEAEVCRLVQKDGEATSVTVRALLERAMAFANLYGPATAERRVVGVCLYHSVDLLAAFIGALWAGHIPTMLAPPSPRMEPVKYSNSFCRMLEHIKPAFVVVDHAASAKLDQLSLKEFPQSTLVDPASVPANGVAPLWTGEAGDVAVLQHSSGTTGLQKGVTLSHRAIINHNGAYAERLRLTAEDRIVSWLPLYHDMGFIACFLLPLLLRIPFVQISPFDWVLRPVTLFEQIQRQRATVCWMPNFGFQFLADSVRPSQISDDLDLGSIRAWVNCSEPVQHAAHTAFYDRFHKYGVRWNQFTASYAMAENVFAVSQSLPGEYRTLAVNRRLFAHEHRIEPDGTTGATIVVSNGSAVEGTEVAVLDDDQQPLPENHVGELAIRGDYRFDGYFRREDLTQDSLTADGWYRTGDLGFIRQGEIYVTGRQKDLIIIQGRNFYPADIEKTVAEIEGLIPGRIVVFGLASEKTGTEGLVVVAEAVDYAGEPGKQLALKIRNAVAQEMDCTPSDVRIVPPRWLIKSTAGKLARDDNRTKYLEHFVKEDQTSPAYV